MRYAWRAETPIGPLALVEEDGSLTEARFGGAVKDEIIFKTPLLEEAEKQLKEYFRGERTAFTLPLAPKGTAFQHQCWQALLSIPYGETRSYQQQAFCIGSPKACRAVGMANHRNPLPVFIPCHRVVGKNGKLTGYAGGLNVKETLLTIERTYRK